LCFGKLKFGGKKFTWQRRFFHLKSVKNLKVAKQKSPIRWQLNTFGWLILNLKLGEKFHINFLLGFL
jgi:hypothetical protein